MNEARKEKVRRLAAGTNFPGEKAAAEAALARLEEPSELARENLDEARRRMASSDTIPLRIFFDYDCVKIKPHQFWGSPV